MLRSQGKSQVGRPVTLRQVAEVVGLSVQTVSSVLGGTRAALYRPETVEQVRAAAAKLGYRPHLFARATRTGRTGFIGLLNEPNTELACLPQFMMDGMHLTAAAQDLGIHMAHLGPEGEVPPNLLDQRLVDGLIVNRHCEIPESLVETLAHSSLPAVWINADRPFDVVLPDDHGAGRLATERLLELAHRRIVYLDFVQWGGGRPLHLSMLRRWEGHQEAMRAAGLESRRLHPDREPDDWQDWYRRLLGGPDRPTGIVSNCTDLAKLVGMAVIGLGLRLPADLSIITFADVNARTVVPVPFARVPWRRIGSLAVEMLQARIAGAAPQPPQLVPFVLIEDGGLAPPA